MHNNEYWHKVTRSPKRYLALYWGLWKSFVFILALASPGIGYDSSTDVLLAAQSTPESPNRDLDLFRYGLQKFVRWDAIYFTKIAQRGYLFEQEWAFGWGFTRLLHLGARVFSYIINYAPVLGEASFGILLAHVSHLLSVLLLYDMSRSICNRGADDERTKFAFVAALLHVVSPAGIFLTAPYAESPFALLNFLGCYFYLKVYDDRATSNSLGRGLSRLASGLCFGIATTFRGNGLLSGCVFAYDVSVIAWEMLSSRKVLNYLHDFSFTVAAGGMVALGSLVPQLLAFNEYCLKIITRLSSGYPVWYWWLASLILEDGEVRVLGKYWSPPKMMVQWMIVYALIQGGLFASFLPPA
ncbi:MAG: hypothetical protein Q9195_001355 [Heterodermia aff. obscurata]